MSIKKIITASLAGLMIAGVGTGLSNQNVNARRRHVRTHRTYRHYRRHSSRSSQLHMTGNGSSTVKLTKPVKVHFIYMAYYPVNDRSVRTKTLRRGTVLHAWYKGTEGVIWCVNGRQARMTKRIWPSANLTKHNCRVIHNYKYRYGYEYMMKKLFHEWN